MAFGSLYSCWHNVGLALLLISSGVTAYIPASPTNDTNRAIANGLNVTDVSRLSLEWFSGGYDCSNRDKAGCIDGLVCLDNMVLTLLTSWWEMRVRG